MATCFVMQPFDGGTFDNRYNEIIAPAVREAGLEPYRVDQDPSVSIPIQDIERGIRQAQVCVAEITLDNPNVWFELGYAIACGKEVVLICSDSRTTRFPFDVQHRTIIRYTTGSPSDFNKLKTGITDKIRAYLKKAETLGTVSEMSQLVSDQAGFAQHEIVALAAVAQNIDHSDDHASTFQIRRDMEANGFTPVATTFALKILTRDGYLRVETMSEGYNDQYYGYSLTEKGWAWVLKNQDKFSLQNRGKAVHSSTDNTQQTFDNMRGDIPF